MSSWTEGSLGGNGLTVVRAVGIVAPWHDRPRSTDTPRVSRTRVSPLSPSYRIGELASAWSSMSGREVTPSSWAFVAIGVVVRVRDYAYDRALWLDESLLSLTIIDRPLWGVFSRAEPQSGCAARFSAGRVLLFSVAASTHSGCSRLSAVSRSCRTPTRAARGIASWGTRDPSSSIICSLASLHGRGATLALQAGSGGIRRLVRLEA